MFKFSPLTVLFSIWIYLLMTVAGYRVIDDHMQRCKDILQHLPRFCWACGCYLPLRIKKALIPPWIRVFWFGLALK